MQSIKLNAPFSMHRFQSVVLPHINPFSFDGNVNFGDSVQLTCHVAKGDLPLEIHWLFNGNPLFAHLNVLTSKLGDRSSFLIVPSVTADNGGRYTCAAKNAAGNHNYTAKLNVLGRKCVPEENPCVTC